MDKEKTFCILPFVHLYTQPDGEVKPCCIASGFEEIESLQKKSIKEIYNSTQFKQLRSDMMNGVKNKVCDVCYKKEENGESSPRNMFNSNATWDLPEIKDDYSVPIEFQHIDIRFSNLCNYKCKMCNHNFSSNWYEDSLVIEDEGEYIYKSEKHIPKKILKASDTIVEDLIPHLGKIKSFYFAGGEPLIMPEHFKLLTWLYDNLPVKDFIDRYQNEFKSRDLSLHYNTNLSVIKYDEQSLIDLWRGFKRVYLSISCDGVNEVGEYQRTGFKMNKFEENLKTIKKFAKPSPVWNQEMGILYGFQYTTTSLNIHHIFEFIDYMLEKKHINSSEEIDFYYAWSPRWISISNMDNDSKRKINKLFEKKLKNIKSEKTKNELMDLIKFMNQPKTHSNERIKKIINKLDVVNETKYTNIFNIN